MSIRALTIAAAVGAGVNGGVFFAFSTFVMKALRQLPDTAGLVAMQRINKAAPSPLFMIALFGTAVISVAVGIDGIRHWDQPGSPLRVIGAASYLMGIALTIGYHIPHNNALAALDPHDSGAAAAWVRYAGPWTAWNHVRTIASIASAAVFAVSLNP